MQLIAGFESSAYVEIALEEIKEKCGVTEERIAFVAMKPHQQPQTFFDTIHYSDGSSVMDAICVGAVLGGVVGIIYGSVTWFGSMVVGLLGFVAGGFIGFLIDKWIVNRPKRKPVRHVEILLVIRCESNDQAQRISDICRNNHVISMGLHGKTVPQASLS